MPRLLPALILALLLSGAARAAVVTEFTGLYPIRVERIAAPTSVAEVVRLVRENPGPVSVGGGRFSMGGQTATEGALQIDMRRMDRVLVLSPVERTIRVEAGITWRKIQEAIDPYDLSLKIMQSYANFTVGGALSVNCHGRYVNQGSVIRSVRSIQIVLADGKVVEASPTSNSEVFYGAIGGYGAVGVITAATLELEANTPLERTAKMLPIAEYPSFFFSAVKGSTTAVFHNGDIYPPEYDRVAAVTFSKTSRPVTVKDRLRTWAAANWRTRLLQLWLSERSYAKRLRAEAIDPILLKAKPVVWRNYEASYDVASLAPFSRKKSTYVLQEYFVPVERFGVFTPKMSTRRPSAAPSRSGRASSSPRPSPPAGPTTCPTRSSPRPSSSMPPTRAPRSFSRSRRSSIRPTSSATSSGTPTSRLPPTREPRPTRPSRPG